MRIDPLFAKYFKMISFGVPFAFVQKLTADNIYAESIHIFVSGHGELDASAVAAGDIKPNGTTAEQKTRRKTPFRRVFFDTLPDTCTGTETVWAATPVLPLTLLSEDATELRVRFAAASSQKSSSPAKSKKPVQRLVDGKRLANLSIGIKPFERIDGFPQSLADEIVSFELRALSSEQLRALTLLMPTEAETRQLKGHRVRSKMAPLPAENFLLCMCNTAPRIGAKALALRALCDFAKEVAEAEQRLEEAISAHRAVLDPAPGAAAFVRTLFNSMIERSRVSARLFFADE